MSDLISVVVPVYNTEKYLRKCIDSIINQTYKNLDIILVDDGSPDNCGDICEEYALADNRIKVIHQKNGGLSSARNTGIDHADGEYITFIDSDDYVEKEFIGVLKNISSENSADIAICDILNENCAVKSEQETVKSYSNIEALYLLMGEKHIPFVNGTSKLIKKSLFDNLKFKEGVIHEDEYIAAELLYEAKNIVYINRGMYRRVMSDSSITRSEYSLKKLDILTALERRMQFFEKINQPKLYAMNLNTYMSRLIFQYKKCKNHFPEEKDILRKLTNKKIKTYGEILLNKHISLKKKLGITFLMIKGGVFLGK